MKFVAFDVETTGIIGFSARMVEIAGVKILGGAPTDDSFHSLVNPQIPIPKDVTAVHGITDEDVKNAPTADSVLEGFSWWVKGDEVLIAHNAPYDIQVLAGEFARVGRKPPTWICVDTCAWARLAIKSYSYKLSALARRFSIDEGRFHRARADALTTAKLFCLLARNFGLERSLEELWLTAPGAILSTFKMGAQRGAELPSELAEIGRAMEDGSDLFMVYEGGTRGPAERRVAPRLLLTRGGIAYMEAWCYETNQLKTFRLERIKKVRLAEEVNTANDLGEEILSPGEESS